MDVWTRAFDEVMLYICTCKFELDRRVKDRGSPLRCKSNCRWSSSANNFPLRPSNQSYDIRLVKFNTDYRTLHRLD